MKASTQRKPPRSLYRLIPWAALGFLFLVTSLYKVLQFTWVNSWPFELQIGYELFILALLSVLVYILSARVINLLEEYSRLNEKLVQAESIASTSRQRLEEVFRLSQRFVAADDEKEIIDLCLNISIDIAGAEGASYVPLDEYGQPLAAVTVKDTSNPVPDAFIEYLASPATRQSCKVCLKPNHLSSTCPLLVEPFSHGVGVYCMPLRRGEREFGVLNLFIKNTESIDQTTRSLLQSLVDETAMALEGIRLRRRELDTIRHIQAVREKTDLFSLVSSLLENIHQTLEADFAILSLQGLDMSPSINGNRGAINLSNENQSFDNYLVKGKYPSKASAFIESILAGVLGSREPIILGDVSGEPGSAPVVRALMAVPILDQGGSSMGAILVGDRLSHSFNQRQLSLLQAVVDQIGQLVQTTRQMAELEYRTMMEERTRLAREIHDGLAQTLGFLKLQFAQMQGYLERGERERLDQTMSTCYQALSDAYQEARNAIDGLRISPCGNDLSAWLQQTVDEFQENMGSKALSITLSTVEIQEEIPAEIQAQLIRIVQEALSNVRKHSNAKNAWVSCYQQGHDLVLEIRDDGEGFSLEEIGGPSRHGLRGMKERAELIKADFQVITHLEEGTVVRLNLPLEMKETIS